MEDYTNYTDEQLITRIHQSSDPEDSCMDYLLEKYKPLVRKKTNALFLMGAESEDLIQEGMIGLFKAVRDFRSDKESSFFHFAELCINRQLYTAIEASNRKKNAPLNTYISFEDQMLSGQEESPEQMLLERELFQEFLNKLNDSLSKMEKQVLSFYLEGKSYLEIAAVMDKSPKSIDNCLQRIKQKVGSLKGR